MGFLFPLFFVALVALAIPILIHLFNLRRYKKLHFPSLFFLRQYIVQNKKMSQVQKKWLLLARLLTLLFLIIAFAQPFLSHKGAGKEKITVIYIDNSASSSYRETQLTILDKAKQTATEWLAALPEGSYTLISNDNLYNDARLSKQEVKQAISNLSTHHHTVYPHQLQLALEQLAEENIGKEVNAVVFSDVQRATWQDNAQNKNIKNKQVRYYFVPIALTDKLPANVSIDSCYFLDMPMDATQSAVMITTMRKYGNEPAAHQLSMRIDDQVKSSKEISWAATDTIKYDTAAFPLRAASWNKIKVSIQDPNATFDNDFFVAARAANAHNALVLTPANSSPYLSAAIRSSASANAVIQSFNPNTVNNSRAKYPLIVLDNVTTLSDAEVSAIKQWLDQGQALAIFFGMNASVSQLNNQLKKIAPISISGIDTTLQQTVDLQSSHPLLQQVLAQVPDNVQLPYTQYAYKLRLGITTAAQPVMKFRDGTPFFAQLSIGNGMLYLCASPLQESATSFVTSHYFAPMVQKMLSNNALSNVFAVTIGQTEPIWINAQSKEERNIFKLKSDTWEAVPLQQAKGAGTNVFIPESIPEPGHYLLTNGQQSDEVILGANASRSESDLSPTTSEVLRRTFNPELTSVASDIQQLRSLTQSGTSFPLWKIALIIALAWMALETYFLVKKK